MYKHILDPSHKSWITIQLQNVPTSMNIDQKILFSEVSITFCYKFAVTNTVIHSSCEVRNVSSQIGKCALAQLPDHYSFRVFMVQTV
jgi:hypothetical protein